MKNGFLSKRNIGANCLLYTLSLEHHSKEETRSRRNIGIGRDEGFDDSLFGEIGEERGEKRGRRIGEWERKRIGRAGIDVA